MPHEELERLRQEVDHLKKNPIHATRQAATLQTSVEELTAAINKLITLFTSTNERLIKDFRRTTIQEHFAKISSQNEQIAQGILTLADMVRQSSPPPAPKQEASSAQGSSLPPLDGSSVPTPPLHDPSSQQPPLASSSTNPSSPSSPPAFVSQDSSPPPTGDSSSSPSLEDGFALPPPQHKKKRKLF